jgi:uncharacterized protein (DUF1499 family)
MLHDMPIDPIDLRTLRPGRRPNRFFIAPARYANLAADALSPALPLPADRLFELACTVILRQPRVRQAAIHKARRQARFEQRSAGLGFVDDIDLAAEPLDAHQSALAIYSRSRLGYWDFGVNRRRVYGWLEQICAEVRPALPPLETSD